MRATLAVMCIYRINTEPVELMVVLKIVMWHANAVQIFCASIICKQAAMCIVIPL